MEAFSHLDDPDVAAFQLAVLLKDLAGLLGSADDPASKSIPRYRLTFVSWSGDNHDVEGDGLSCLLELVQVGVDGVSSGDLEVVLTEGFKKFTPRLLVAVVISERECPIIFENPIDDL